MNVLLYDCASKIPVGSNNIFDLRLSLLSRKLIQLVISVFNHLVKANLILCWLYATNIPECGPLLFWHQMYNINSTSCDIVFFYFNIQENITWNFIYKFSKSDTRFISIQTWTYDIIIWDTYDCVFIHKNMLCQKKTNWTWI